MTLPLHTIALGILLAIGLTVTPKAEAADATVINIVPDDKGDLVFDKPDVKIEAGTSVQWVPAEGGRKHHLVSDEGSEIKLNTGPFNVTAKESKTQEFPNEGRLSYQCLIHETMVGTIEVKKASE